MTESDKGALTARMVEWSSLWDVDSLAEDVSIAVAPRLRRTLGRYLPARREIQLAPFMLTAPEPLLLEVLCHEAAHAAAYLLHGTEIRAHGREWRALMSAAGMTPRARFPAEELVASGVELPPQRARARWHHQCPVCHAARTAGKPMRRWVCARCRGVGLKGTLEVTRINPSRWQQLFRSS